MYPPFAGIWPERKKYKRATNSQTIQKEETEMLPLGILLHFSEAVGLLNKRNACCKVTRIFANLT